MKLLFIFFLILEIFLIKAEQAAYAELNPNDEPVIASESGINSNAALAACNRSVQDWIYWRKQFSEQYKITQQCTARAINGSWTAIAHGQAWSSPMPQEQY